MYAYLQSSSGYPVNRNDMLWSGIFCTFGILFDIKKKNLNFYIEFESFYYN